MMGDSFRGARAPSRAGDGALAIANSYFLGGSQERFGESHGGGRAVRCAEE